VVAKQAVDDDYIDGQEKTSAATSWTRS
jgi:hypothetical protein